ncbi:sulfur carrier protein ThiS [Veillonella sp. VA142]|uniref:sulfur carrier protein ThiS n=1 Tax=Veillonella sp. VA142 TaxID=741834 RepID=UPI000F8E1625|nr:sulfur carrier protein ThiS [Veillonella sp. VA142]
MKVNGSTYNYEGQTVQEVLEDLAFRIDRIVVEYNGKILSKAEWESTRVSAADIMEVVTFVGGG